MTSKKLLYNLNLTDNLITLGNLNSNNIICTNISTSSLSISSTSSFDAITVSNAVLTNLSSGNINATSSTISNSIFTNISTSSLSISGTSSFDAITVSNAVLTNLSSGSINATSSTISNSIFTNITTSSLLAIGNSNTLGSIITTDGNVGINITNPSYKLDVNGTINANTYTGGNISISGVLNSNTISSNVISSNTITGGNLYLSNNVFIGGSLTTVNITTTNLVDVTISSGSVYTNNVTATNIVGTAVSTGTFNATTSVTSAALYANNITATNIVSTAVSSGTVNVDTLVSSSNIATSAITVGTLLSTAITSGALAVRNTSDVTSSIKITNSSGTLEFGINPSSSQNGASYLWDYRANDLRIGTNNTERIRVSSRGNVGIGTNAPAFTLDVSGTLNASTSVTSAALYATNVTATNIVGTAVSAGTLAATTSVTSAALYAANVTATNIVGTAVSTGTLAATTSVTSAALYTANVTATNIVGTAVSAGTLAATTSVTSAALYAANVTATNIVGTAVSAGTLAATTSVTSAALYAANVTATNIVGTTISTGTIIGTNSTVTNTTTSSLLVDTLISSANIVASLITTGTLNATTVASSVIASNTITSGSIYASGDLFVGGTITTVNITSTNLVETNVSAGIVLASTRLSAPGNSNTLGSIITTGGNVGIGKTTPGSKLHVQASDTTSLLSTWVGGSGSYNQIDFSYDNSSVLGTAASARIKIQDNNYGANIYFQNRNQGSDSSTMNTRLYIAAAGNVGIATTVPSYTLDVSGTFRATTSVTSGAVYATNVTAAQIVGTTISSGTIVGTNSTVTNTVNTALSSGTIVGTNITSTNIVGTTISAGTLVATTSVTSAALYVNNITAVQIVGTNISSGTILGTNSTVTNTVHTALSSGTIVGTNITSTNIVGTTISTGTLFATTRVSSANLNSANISTGTLVAVNNSNTLGSLITTGGNVGIGTNSPTSKLELKDTTGSSNAPFIKISGGGGAGNQVGIKLSPWSGRTGGDSAQIIAVDDGSASANLLFYTAPAGDGSTPTERMRITSDGNVGIGTNNPATPLEINSSSINNGFRHTNSSCSIETYNDGTNAFLQTYTNNSLHFSVSNGSSILCINTAGSIGINSTRQTGILDIRSVSLPAYSNTQLTTSYHTTITHNETTNGSLGIGFAIAQNPHLITPGASIIHERTGNNSLGLLHFCTKSGASAASATLIRMTIQTSGNVGIGTTAPTSTLQINGSLAKTSGTFDIKHPIVSDKRLVHSFIEGPRCDLIYRGTATLQNGQAIINLDTECVAEQGSEMTQGTFEALCTNPDYYLQNNTSFDRVKGSISGNILTIVCENSSSADKISWMVVAERKDESIKEWSRTNSNGFLITEYSS